MASQQITYSEPVRAGNREYRQSSDGRQWCRRLLHGAWGTWEEYTPEQPPVQPQQSESASTCLWLVRERQTAGPYHWLLAVASEEGGVGDLYQVTGDAAHMRYDHVKRNAFDSIEYYDSYNLGTLDGHGKSMVEYCADRQSPPSAENAAAITENCQGWCVRVLEDLEARGVISAGSATRCQPIMEPLFW
ncbi:hypothetical protein F5Y01DRAFT_319536 [Xylaria sp. FL0043]|nr:hypothetical protein F5Y01DRAFT_319536 [Xylaria sp. FL0043]